MGDDVLRTPDPILVAPLFREVHAELMGVLDALAPNDWLRPTAAGDWRVRDVAAHLLDGDLRRLSMARDGYRLSPPPGALDSATRLIEWLDTLNAQWVRVAGRLSPRVLRDLLDISGREIAVLMESLDPFAAAPIPVSWAGESASLNWLDAGRELTERWHHQEQIRAAVDRPPLDAPHVLAAVIDVSLRVLPHAYRDVDAPIGTALRLDITGNATGTWSLVRQQDGWNLFEGSAQEPAAGVAIDAYDAAGVLMHRLTPREGIAAARVMGDAEIAAPFFRARAMMVRAPERS